ncbi:TetR/AcrR family transcriptional regulator [Arthrobacter mobilis]|uniref:TetR/AcrR family transcriptional regulator n=1 Tax=Arthrobacter mobilis TaxID=2724944 RepID=UPI00197BAFE0|nr:TetR/AcrR family transcriptional regulator [Arthrobacter mobilis]
MAKAAGTVEKILHEASKLFAAKGYHGTSTRDIAAAVGIRQPSLFYHFPTKHDIAHRLFELDLEETLVLAARSARAGGPALPRLRQIADHELEVIFGSPVDVRGLYLTELLREEEFADWRGKYDNMLAAFAQIIRQGQDGSEILPLDAQVLAQAFDGLLLHAIRLKGRGAAEADSYRPAVLAFLRGISTDPGTWTAELTR